VVAILDENGKELESHAEETIPSSVFLNYVFEHPGQYILAVVHLPTMNGTMKLIIYFCPISH
jgi:hypothetical protein